MNSDLPMTKKSYLLPNSKLDKIRGKVDRYLLVCRIVKAKKAEKAK